MIKKFEDFINESIYGKDGFVSTTTADMYGMSESDKLKNLKKSLESKFSDLDNDSFKRGTIIICNDKSKIIDDIERFIQYQKEKGKKIHSIHYIEDGESIKDEYDEFIKYVNRHFGSTLVIRDNIAIHLLSALDVLQFLKEPHKQQIVLFIKRDFELPRRYETVIKRGYDVFEF